MEEQSTTPVSDAETEALVAIPAFYSNWFFTHRAGNALRITFAERGSPGALPHPRAAVVVDFADLHLVRTLIDNAIRIHEQELSRVGAGEAKGSDVR